MKKRLISFLLVATMVLSMAACGNAEDSKESSEAAVSSEASGEVAAEDITYPLDTDETLTLAMMSYHFKPSGDSKDITDTPFWAAWQEKTGVKLEMEVFETEDAFNLMLASGDLPDILMWDPSLTKGGASGMVENEVLSTLTWDEINKWAPDFGAELSKNDTYRKLATMDDGTITGFPKWNETESMMSTNGMIVRGDWLEDLGMEAPKTPDDLLAMLRAFKTEKGAEYPMALTSHRMNLLFSYGFFTSPYGLVNAWDYVKDGQYHLGYAEPEYKDVLALFNTMYNEKLFNPDYLTVEQSTVDAMLYDGRAGLVQQSVIAGMGAYVPAMAEYDPEAKIAAIGSLLGPNGERAFYGATELPVTGFKALITTECENKELAMKFLNYGYTEEGVLFLSYGIEGESYDMVDGVPVFKDFITNPTDRTAAQAMQQYCRSGAFWPSIATLSYFEQSTAMPEQRQAVAVWDENDRYTYMAPYIDVAVEDQAEFSKLNADIETYVYEMRAKFISGEVSLDEFDTYLQELKDKGVDRVIEIKQKALDNFNAK